MEGGREGEREGERERGREERGLFGVFHTIHTNINHDIHVA